MEVTGTFDLMIEAALPSITAYHAWLEQAKGPFAGLIARYEANFVCKRFVRVPKKLEDRVLWVPVKNGKRRVDMDAIDKVTAEGDYMRIHSGHNSWMVHMTLRELADYLGERDFVHVHRSIIIRCGFIDRLVHQGRHWLARLRDGSVQRIAKSHVVEVLNKLRVDPAKSGALAAKEALLDETGLMVDETEMQR
jgi:DNA-binding LytR/AlgR family response regulator